MQDTFLLHATRNVQALAVRQQGKAAPLKDFHNHIKRLMIKRYKQQARPWQDPGFLPLTS